MLSLSSQTTFVTFLLTFCGTFSTTCLHSSCGTTSQLSVSRSSQTSSFFSLQTSSWTFSQSLMGMSLHTSSSTNSSVNLVTGPHFSTGLERQEPSTGSLMPFLTSSSQMSSRPHCCKYFPIF